jgi:hypothetical protein
MLLLFSTFNCPTKNAPDTINSARNRVVYFPTGHNSSSTDVLFIALYFPHIGHTLYPDVLFSVGGTTTNYFIGFHIAHGHPYCFFTEVHVLTKSAILGDTNAP